MDRYRGRLCAAFKPLIPAICNKDNGLTLKIPKAYLTAGNRFKSDPILYVNPTSKPALECVQNSSYPGKIMITHKKWAD